MKIISNIPFQLGEYVLELVDDWVTFAKGVEYYPQSDRLPMNLSLATAAYAGVCVDSNGMAIDILSVSFEGYSFFRKNKWLMFFYDPTVIAKINYDADSVRRLTVEEFRPYAMKYVKYVEDVLYADKEMLDKVSDFVRKCESIYGIMELFEQSESGEFYPEDVPDIN